MSGRDGQYRSRDPLSGSASQGPLRFAFVRDRAGNGALSSCDASQTLDHRIPDRRGTSRRARTISPSGPCAASPGRRPSARSCILAALTVLVTPWGTPGRGSWRRRTSRSSARSCASRTASGCSRTRSGHRQARRADAHAGRPPARHRARVRRHRVRCPHRHRVARRRHGHRRRARPFLGRLGWSARPDIDGLIARASTARAQLQQRVRHAASATSRASRTRRASSRRRAGSPASSRAAGSIPSCTRTARTRASTSPPPPARRSSPPPPGA
jgi:hypothetical protein